MKISSWTHLVNTGFDSQNYPRFMGTDNAYRIEFINVCYRKSKGIGVWVYGLDSDNNNVSLFVRSMKIIDVLKEFTKKSITFKIVNGGVKSVI